MRIVDLVCWLFGPATPLPHGGPCSRCLSYHGRLRSRDWKDLLHLAAIIIAATLTGCSSAGLLPADGGRFTPEPPHPTPERISELARVNVPPPGDEAPLSVAFWPSIILEGGSSWMTVFVPQSQQLEVVFIDGQPYRAYSRIRLTLPGVWPVVERDAPRGGLRRFVERPPCGEHTAVLEVATRSGRRYRTEAKLVVRGQCNEGEEK